MFPSSCIATVTTQESTRNLYPLKQLYHKWDVTNGFAFVLQFFSLISDGLGGVILAATM